MSKKKKKTHDGGDQVQGVVLESIDDVDVKSAILPNSESESIMRSSREHHLRSPDYWARKNTIGKGGSTAWDELELISL